MNSNASTISRSQVIVGCLLSAFAALMFQTLPTFANAAASSLQLSDSEVGALSAAYLGGFALSALIAVFTIRRVPWHKLIVGAAVVNTLSYLAYTGVESFSWALLLQLIIGLSMGQLFSLVICFFGDAADTDRLFSAKVFSEILLGAIMIYLFSALLLPALGFRGILLGFALFSVIAAFAIRVLPAQALPRRALAAEGESRSSLPGFIALLFLTLSFGSLAGLYAFVEIIGQDAGLDRAEVSLSVSLALFLSLVALLVVARWGETLGRVRVIIGATALLLVTFYLLDLPQTALVFFIAMCTLNTGWNVSVPLQMSLVDAFDRTGRLTVAIGVALPLGATLGPPVLGLLKDADRLDLAYGLVALVALVAGTVFALLARKADLQEKQNV